MARKLRIYPGERHEFEGHPDLAAFTMPPRKLREKGQLFELPPGFEPFNPQAYYVSCRVAMVFLSWAAVGWEGCCTCQASVRLGSPRSVCARAANRRRTPPLQHCPAQAKYGHRLGKGAEQQQEQQPGGGAAAAAAPGR